MTRHRASHRAADAWDCHPNRCESTYVREGFIDGFVAVSMGSRGCTPAVAPSKYWGWQYSGAEGQLAGDHWLTGYPIGAAAANSERAANGVATLSIPSQAQYNNSSSGYSYGPDDYETDPVNPGPDTIDNTINFEPLPVEDLPVIDPEDAESSAEDAAMQSKDAAEQIKDAAEQIRDAAEDGVQLLPGAKKVRIQNVSLPKTEAIDATVISKDTPEQLPEFSLEKNDTVYGFGIN